MNKTRKSKPARSTSRVVDLQSGGMDSWRQQCERQLKRTIAQRLDYGFVYTYKPVLDDISTRIFDTIAEYRNWCHRNLPRYLGYRRHAA